MFRSGIEVVMFHVSTVPHLEVDTSGFSSSEPGNWFVVYYSNRFLSLKFRRVYRLSLLRQRSRVPGEPILARVAQGCWNLAISKILGIQAHT
jgi:hypothetical protein